MPNLEPGDVIMINNTTYCWQLGRACTLPADTVVIIVSLRDEFICTVIANGELYELYSSALK